MRAHVAGDERVAVRRGVRDAQRAEGAAGPADILHYELLPEMAREDVRHDPPGDVGRPAGRKRHDHSYRSRRVVLGLCSSRSGEQQKRQRDASLLHCLSLTLRLKQRGELMLLYHHPR